MAYHPGAIGRRGPISFKTGSEPGSYQRAMLFSYDPKIGQDHPTLVTGLLSINWMPEHLNVEAATFRFTERARRNLVEATEAELPAIRAWRSAFSAMGLKPTKYRCASEALLRRLRKDGALPRLHPLVDLANAVSVAHAVPVAVFDMTYISGNLTVRPAIGQENYHSFGGTDENPEAGEIIFADDDGAAHARRWTNRQSAASAVSENTVAALVVIEALHADGEADVLAARGDLAVVLAEQGAETRTEILRGGEGHFDTETDKP